MDLYAYYRIHASHADQLNAQAVAIQADLTRECSVIAALKRGPEEKDGRHTWMEVYLAVPDAFDSVLERAVSQAKLATLIDGERHIEYFLDLSTCA